MPRDVGILTLGQLLQHRLGSRARMLGESVDGSTFHTLVVVLGESLQQLGDSWIFRFVR